MSAVSDVVAALISAGLPPAIQSHAATQGAVVTVPGYPRALRLYAWEVSDNGRATGIVRPADERRIQASRTQPLEVLADPETLVLGWCEAEAFSQSPLIVAFNASAVAARVNAKLGRKIGSASQSVRVSDSQQFRQSLIDDAGASGLAVGQNQHGEYVVAMKPERFLDYLHGYKPRYHSVASATALPQLPPQSMRDLVAEAERDEAEPVDDDPAQPPVFDPAAIEDGRERVAREIAIRRGQAAFRRALMQAYGCCAMTGCTVEPALEAAHIVPYQGPGTNHVTNGLLLRADLHSLFDFGLLSVDPATLTILVSPDLDATEYEGMRRLPLRLGRAARAAPNLQALALHRSFAGL